MSFVQFGERERKVWKVFEKVVWTSQICLFKKTWFTTFDWSKINFNCSKQTKASLKIWKQFRLIEKQIGSIEANIGFLKNFKTLSIDWKTDWINRNRQMPTKFLRKNTVLKNLKTHFRNTSKHWNWWTKCMSMWWNVFQKQSFKPSFPKIKIIKHFP